MGNKGSKIPLRIYRVDFAKLEAEQENKQNKLGREILGAISVEPKIEEGIDKRETTQKLFEKLTKRQRKIAKLIMEGYTEEEIAERLSISHQRVNQIKKEIGAKLRCFYSS